MILKRWEVGFRGRESGDVHPMPFMRFWRRSEAERWALRLTDRRRFAAFEEQSTNDAVLTLVEVVLIDRRQDNKVVWPDGVYE